MPTPPAGEFRLILSSNSARNPFTIDGFERNTFILQVEVIEVKAKKSGEAILGLGKLDTDPQFLFPMDPGVIVREASSDHLMVRMDPPPRVGDWVSFRLGYPALCRLMASPYVQVEYVNELKSC